jgi:4,5-dihydroxyphthalate decarboxylase
MKLPLSIAFAANPRTWPILDGSAAADGIDLVPSVVHPSELFYRQLKFADWDVAEMSFSSLMIAIARGDDRFVGLPIFTTRRFFHAHILVRKDSGIEVPGDLKGRRVGVTEYQQTAALWTRGVLEHEFGVRPEDIEFFMERTPAHSHGGATGFTPPPGVRLTYIPPEKNVGSMMLAGELDAALHYRGQPSLVNRSSANLREHAAISTLFPDPIAEGMRYYRKTGLYPINHGMCIKRDIVARHPWVVLNLMKAFEQANAMADNARLEHVAAHLEAGLIGRDALEGLTRPVISHGIAANRQVLETAARYSVEQGLTPRLIRLDEIFAPATLDRR